LIAAEHHKVFVGDLTKSGVNELDTLLGGGSDRGTSALLVGGAGVGKSSIAVTYAVGAAERGERGHVCHRTALHLSRATLGRAFAQRAAAGPPFLQRRRSRGRSHLLRSSLARNGVHCNSLYRKDSEGASSFLSHLASWNEYFRSCWRMPRVSERPSSVTSGFTTGTIFRPSQLTARLNRAQYAK
jgi:hypothetical protein